ncbi:MAG: hypothetical protein OSA51_10885 [Octadecabacter sp.]|nr:hypothetical protein [Octadecabacter sp.]
MSYHLIAGIENAVVSELILGCINVVASYVSHFVSNDEVITAQFVTK